METEAEQEKLYNQFAQERSEVERLAKRIETKIGRPVEVRPTKRPSWGFYTKWEEDRDWENFAYARRRKRAKCLRTSTKEEWAIRAGVDRSRYSVSPKGWWGEPAAYVDMNQDNAESLEEVASILARICQARHR